MKGPIAATIRPARAEPAHRTTVVSVKPASAPFRAWAAPTRPSASVKQHRRERGKVPSNSRRSVTSVGARADVMLQGAFAIRNRRST